MIASAKPRGIRVGQLSVNQLIHMKRFDRMDALATAPGWVRNG
jgi:hypothetical protein